MSASRGRTRKSLTLCFGAAALSSASVLVALTPGAASAAMSRRALPPGLAMFKHCPVSNKAVRLCVFSQTTSNTFVIGSTVVTSSAPTTLSLGAYTKPNGTQVTVVPTDGTSALNSPAVPLPGIEGDLLGVAVRPQLVGVPSLTMANLLSRKGTGLALPVDVSVTDSAGLLGSSCTIGAPADHITMGLTTGTTNPPAPNAPASGSPGTIHTNAQGVITVTGMRLVDNAFAVPGAYNCGPFGLLDSVLNWDKSLPSPAGTNSVTLVSTAYIAPAALIRTYIG